MRIFRFFFLVFVLTAFACNRSSTSITSLDPAFKQHIYGYTYGVIQRESKITIVLADSVDKKKQGKISLQDLFVFEPEIKGSVEWFNNRTIVFTPEERLPSGTKYSGVFNLGEIKHVKRSLRRFPLHFESQEQSLQYKNGNLSYYSRYNNKYMYLTGRISLNSYEDIEFMEKISSASLNGKQLKIKWNHSRNADYWFRIDSVERTGKDQVLSLKLDLKELWQVNTLERTFDVPGLDRFELISQELIQEPDQKLQLTFSEYLAAGQDLNGLITINGIEDLSYQISGNTVYVYFKKRYSGQKQLQIHGMIKNYFGYPMGENYTNDLFFESTKPQIKLIGEGNIVPAAGGVFFPFETIGLKKVDVRIFKIRERNIAQFLQVNTIGGNNELRRVGEMVHESTVDLAVNGKNDTINWIRQSLDLRKLVKTEPGAIYRVMLSFKRSYTAYECADDLSEDNDHSASENEMFYDYYGDQYYYMNNYDPCNSQYYYRSSRTRNILVSDVGMIAKLGNDKKLHVIINDINSAKTVQGVKVSVYSYDHQKLRSGITNSEGTASWTLVENEEPYLVIAEHGTQRGYLKMNDGASNSLSKFEVDGARTKDGIDGFIYAERGVWRPGDSIYINFVLNDKQHALPASHPVQFELLDPQGKPVVKDIKTTSLNGVFDFYTATNIDATTGTYRAVVTVGTQKFYHAVKIESVKPNRLKMDLEFENKMLKSYESNKGTISSEWLHGAKASGLKSSVNVSLFNSSYEFENFSDYTFTDPTKSFSSEEIILVEQNLDDNGKTSFEANFPTTSNAPGVLLANFVTKVYEKSGNFSIDQFAKYLSPYKQYVGVRIPKGSLEYGTLVTDQAHKIEFATVSEDGKPLDKKKVQVKIYKLEWRWWWNRQNDLSSFISSSSIIPTVDTVLVSKNGTVPFNFQVNQPEWGRFFVQATDLESGHSTGKIFYVDWPYWARKNKKQNDNATMLSFSTDKAKYNKGDDVKITIPAATKGKALVCVENGYEVLKKYWINVDKGDNKTSFKTTPDMAPNVYVHVTSILEYSETSENQPARLYGIVPIYIEDPMTRLSPEITMKDSIRPDTKNTVSVSEKSGKAMTYTVAIVDEGLLQLTHFSTPNPWDHFFKKQALGVRTWDMYDDVLGSFAGKWGNLLSIGGDGSAENPNKTVKANRFKPVVKTFGPYYLPAGDTKTHSFEIENYVGAVRVMVVASDVANNAYGNHEKQVKVKKPLMVVSTMPRVVSPGEELEFPVNVFAMSDKIKDVNIQVEVNDKLSLPEGSSKAVHFNKRGDKIVSFPVKVSEKMGIAKIRVDVSGNGEKAFSEIELDVRAPNPEVTNAKEWVLKGGESTTAPVEYFGMEGTNNVTLEISTIPSVNLRKRLNYLIQYPHGCVEQTTSAVFPQLALNELVDLTTKQKNDISRNIQAGINRLSGFRTSSGGFSYWPGSNNASEWGSNYAGHFLLEAKKRGYKVQSHVISNWATYQSNEARSWYPSGYYNNDNIQAYRLYTLALAGKPEVSAMNRLREYKNLSNMGRWRLAAAYGLIGKPEAAKALINGANLEVKDYRELGYTFGSGFRDQAMMLEIMVEIGDMGSAANLMMKVAGELSSAQWMSTQETALGLLAISKFAGEAKVVGNPSVSYQVSNGASNDVILDKHLYSVDLGREDLKGKKVTIKNTSEGIVYVKMVHSGVPLIGDTTRYSNAIEANIRYTNFEGLTIDVTDLAQGTQFIAEVQIYNPGSRGGLEQVALSQMMPSGWEIQNTRMQGSGIKEDSYTYRDHRDDRVMTYFDLPVRTSKTFRIILTAAYQGRYYLPAQTAEAMYDYTVRANLPGKWVTVSPPRLDASR